MLDVLPIDLADRHRSFSIQLHAWIELLQRSTRAHRFEFADVRRRVHRQRPRLLEILGRDTRVVEHGDARHAGQTEILAYFYRETIHIDEQQTRLTKPSERQSRRRLPWGTFTPSVTSVERQLPTAEFADRTALPLHRTTSPRD